MSKHPQEIHDKAIALLKTGLDNTSVAGMVSAEFGTEVSTGAISAWRGKAGLPKGKRRVIPGPNQPMCRDFNKLVKHMKPVSCRLKQTLEKSYKNL